VILIKVLFTYNYGLGNMNRIKELGYEVVIVKENEVINSDEINDSDILVCYNPFESLDVSKMNNLKWIQLSSAGIDQLPLDIVRSKGIKITNNKGGYSIPIGEWIVLKILEMLKKSSSLYKNQQCKKWKMDMSLLELYGKSVGFIGTGSIATEAAKRLRGFGVDILGVNTSGTDVEYFNKCFSVEKIDDMLKLCDIVAITIPHTEKTHHMVDQNRFSAMKDGVFIVNIARGNIIDEKALINNIRNGKISAAALDVFEEEPLNQDNPLWEFDNVIITSHNSWVSEQINERRFKLIYENLRRYSVNEELVNVVDLNKGY
jgi:phosphoglycerate dehydrogenase-like enzyme